jgi:hypothetical protein
VHANADIDTLVPRFAVEAYLEQLFAEPAACMADQLVADDTLHALAAPAACIPLPVSVRPEPKLEPNARHDWLARLGRPDRSIVSGPYQRTADFRVSTTDPDASPMRTSQGSTRLGYQDHYVVDGGRARIILGVLVAPAEVQENQPALDLLWRARFRWRLHPRQVTGDTKYGSAECRCCTMREQCTTSRRGRRVSRRFDEDDLDRVRAYQGTEPYEKALRKRQVWVEPLFAEAKQWHGLERFRLRGLSKVNTEALLIATGQNLKRLLSRHGWSRRPFPSGAAGVRLDRVVPHAAATRC